MKKTDESLKTRRSIRKYKTDIIPQNILLDILDCGRLAPCGHNKQDWIFVCVTSPETRKKIAAINPWGKFIADAAACIAVLCKKDNFLRTENASAATVAMMIAAEGHGLGTCWVNCHESGHKLAAHAAKTAELIACPPDYEICTLFSVGVPDESPARDKKTLDEVVRWESAL